MKVQGFGFPAEKNIIPYREVRQTVELNILPNGVLTKVLP
jgi:hypothetical protein